MYLIRRPGLALAQPQGAAGIDASNPHTAGLVGLLWVGPGKARDLVNPKIAFTPGGVLTPATVGIGRVATTAQVGATSGYSGVQAIIAPWKIAAKPVTFLAFFDTVGFGGSTSVFAAVTSGGSGFALWNLYGSNTRGCFIYSAGGVRADLGYASSAGTWAAGPQVRGLTHDGATLIGYDAGRQFGSTADATSAIYQDPSFTEVKMLANTGGTGYWMALWNRVLTPAAVLDISQRPWQLVAQPARRVFVPVGVGGGGTSLTPGAAALVLALAAPSVAQTAHIALVPALAPLTLATYAPALTQTNGLSLVPGAAALFLAGSAPVLVRTSSVSLTPGAAALVLASYAPTIAQASLAPIVRAPRGITLPSRSAQTSMALQRPRRAIGPAIEP